MEDRRRLWKFRQGQNARRDESLQRGVVLFTALLKSEAGEAVVNDTQLLTYTGTLRDIDIKVRGRNITLTLKIDAQDVHDEYQGGDVLDVVCQTYDIRRAQLTGKAKNKEVSLARHVAAYLMREVRCMSYPEIGRILRRDHSTIIHSCKVASEQVRKDPYFAKAVCDMEKRIRAK